MDLLRLLGASAILVAMEWRLALVVLIPVPFIALGLRYFNKYARPIYRQARDRLGDINARLEDNLAGIRVTQAFVQEEPELLRFSDASRQYYHQRVRSIRAWSTYFPVLRFLALLGTALVLGFGARMVSNGQVTLGTLVAFLAYSTSFYEPLNRLTEIDNILQQAIAAGERIRVDGRVSDIQDAWMPPLEREGDVVFDDAFPVTKTARKCCTTSISHRTRVVALVGPSGAGKNQVSRVC